MGATFEIFSEGDLRVWLEQRRRRLEERLEGENEEYLLNVNEDEFCRHLVDSVSVEPLVLELDHIEATDMVVQVPAEHFPNPYHADGKQFSRTALVYHVPFCGDRDLLGLRPSQHILWSISVGIDGSDLCFQVIAMTDDPADTNREADSIIRSLRTQTQNVNNDVNAFNSGLDAYVRGTFAKRKEALLKRRGFLSAMNVPLRKRQDLPRTFTVPPPAIPKRITPRPAASTQPTSPEWTLDEVSYRELVQIFYDLGKAFERLPATYAEKREEDLRDHALLYLAPRFDGSATGETFNRSGKTDILLRHQNSNLFVAEFKFWDGPKLAKDAAEQLFSYLTWRDSKTALVFFVRNKKFTEVVTAGKEALASMANFVRENAAVTESWFRYVFHLPGDESRPVQVALLFFHLSAP